jgi:hypothetical protein
MIGMNKPTVQTPQTQAVLSGYNVFLNAIKQKHSDIIEEANNNVHKWFELFVDKGDETQTVDSGDTFDEAIAHFELHAKNWGADNLFMDIWTDKDENKTGIPIVDVSLWSKEDMPDSFSTEIK